MMRWLFAAGRVGAVTVKYFGSIVNLTFTFISHVLVMHCVAVCCGSTFYVDAVSLVTSPCGNATIKIRFHASCADPRCTLLLVSVVQGSLLHTQHSFSYTHGLPAPPSYSANTHTHTRGDRLPWRAASTAGQTSLPTDATRFGKAGYSRCCRCAVCTYRPHNTLKTVLLQSAEYAKDGMLPAIRRAY